MRSFTARTALVAALAVATTSVARAQTLVVLVRHAEKAAQPAADPPLTPEGEARARALADAVQYVNVGAIISTPYLRTTHTAKPLADKLGIQIETVPATVANHAQAVADAVKKHAGKAVLVVGHSNTIPAIAAALGAPKLPDLCDGDYDQIYVLELMPTGPPRFTRARYGAPAADAKCAQTMGR